MSNRRHIRNVLRPRRAIVLVGVVGIFVAAWCALAAGQAPDASLRAQTVIQGLAAREEAVGGVGGEALMWSFYAPSYWQGTGIGDDPRADLSTGQAGDRDVARARFRLGEQRYWYDLQMGLWAGGGPWFVVDFQRAFDDVDDLYLRVLCDGQYVYRYDRSRRVERRGTVAPAVSSARLYRGDIFTTGLGFAVGRLPLSEYLALLLDEYDWRVHSCTSAVLDGQDCQRLTVVIDGERTAGQYDFWIAPEFGYALVRCAYEYFHKDDPSRGKRIVYVWADYREVGDGIHLPHKFTRTTYHYPGGENTREPWQAQSNYEFQHLVAPLGEPNLDPKEYFFPVGTGVAPEGLVIPTEEAARMSGDFVQFMNYGDWVLAKAMPEPDAEFNQPLTGQEMGEIERRYAAAGAP